MPDQYVLEAAYPNPFNPVTTIRFAVAAKQPVSITLVDTQGRTVRTLYSGMASANQMHPLRIDGSRLTSGIYLVKLVGESFTTTRQVVLQK